MKTLLLLISFLLGSLTHQCLAQAPNNTGVVKQELKKLAYMAGRWSGEAHITRGNTPPIKVMQEENVQFKLDETILLIEGIGRNPESNAITFNALAVVSFNPYTKKFAMKSHTMEGNQTEAYFNVLADNHFEWGFETTTKAKIRYNIILNPQEKTWAEKGDYSPDGTTWYPFFEMKLYKQD